MTGGLAIFFINDKIRSFFSHACAIVVCILSLSIMFWSVRTCPFFPFFLRLQVFDILMRDGSLWPLRMLKTHRSLRTLLFMIMSGVIVDSMYLNSDSVFWLFKPLKKYRKHIENTTNESKPTDHNHICHHRHTCDTHILKVMTYTFVWLFFMLSPLVLATNVRSFIRRD